MDNSTWLDLVAAGMGKIIEPVSRYLVYIGAAFSLIMALMVTIDVVLRQFFDSPITGIIELETFMLAVLCFFSLAYTMIREGHVSVDILASKFSDKVKQGLSILFSFLGMSVFGVIGWQYFIRTKHAMQLEELSVVLAWPMWPFFAVTCLGCALIGLVLLLNFLTNIGKFTKKNKRYWILVLAVCLAGFTVIFSPWWLKELSISISPVVTGVILIGLMMVLLFLGLPVAITMALVGILGIWYLSDFEVCMGVVRMSVYDSVVNYFFCVVPFFVLMGFCCLKAGISEKLYSAGHKWFGQMPGGLAIGTIAGCGGFAAICGDSMATSATMGSVALPEMKKYNYDDSLATGSVAAGGTLGILIPPSLGFIVYGIVTEESVGKLFMAGVIPGIMLTTIFALVVYFQCRLNPALGPKGPKTSFVSKIKSLGSIWTVCFLFIMVIGGIYAGFFTPTEAGGVGVVGALLIGLTAKEFTLKQFFQALLASTQVTAMVAGILIGVTILGYFITMTDIPLLLAEYISTLEVSRYVLFALILVLYLVLGMLMSIIPMIMLTLPIVFPTINALGFDPIWFGVIMVVMMEMGQISPPVGINVFVIAGVAKDVAMGKIFKGIIPFVIAEIVIILILTIWPEIVMYLPNSMDVLAPIGE